MVGCLVCLCLAVAVAGDGVLVLAGGGGYRRRGSWGCLFSSCYCCCWGMYIRHNQEYKSASGLID
jgi:hypothetical protein